MVMGGLFIFLLAVISQAAVIPDEDWGYVNVRANANIFWWLYGSQNNSSRDNQPLVIWLQGGPGASGTGFGNFEEIGPLDLNLKPRQYTWAQNSNLMFIDSPVGTGFSYVTDNSAYCTTDEQVGIDLVAVLKAFVSKYPIFQTLPIWIFCESYGGKESTSFAVALVKALQNKDINVNFKGVSLGDSWISPIDFVMAYPDYLYSTSEVDSVGRQAIATSSKSVLNAVNSNSWTTATELWGSNQGVIEQVSSNVDFYNILNPRSANQYSKADGLTRAYQTMVGKYQDDPLTDLMNGPIRQKLGIIPASVTWGGQSDNVFSYMSTAFMQPYIEQVEFLLDSGVNVTVYSGNLDLICCTTGTLAWMDKLTWSYYPNFKTSTHTPVSVNNVVLAFKKQYRNLAFWTILGAGHMVPADQPLTGITMLNTIIGQ